MKLEPIDTSTTAGKIEVMRLAGEGRNVAARVREAGGGFQKLLRNDANWNWYAYDYAIISEPVGPDEVWVLVRDEHDKEFMTEAACKEEAKLRGMHAVRYRRVEE